MSLSVQEQTAHAALRVRQGQGARYDSDGAPAEALLLARRGAAYFARLLNEAAVEDLGMPSRRKGWTRKQVALGVSYHARALANALEGIKAEAKCASPPELSLSDEDIIRGISLPVRALRSLYYHTNVHLNVVWRELSDEDWETLLVTPDSRSTSLQETPLIRAVILWQSAYDFSHKTRIKDIPPAIREYIKTWEK